MLGAKDYDTMEDIKAANLKVNSTIKALMLKWKTNDIDIII